jgi:hypothetical protein
MSRMTAWSDDPANLRLADIVPAFILSLLTNSNCIGGPP